MTGRQPGRTLADDTTLPATDAPDGPLASRPRGRASVHGVTRLAIIVFGGLVVLQSSPGLGPTKLAYLGLAAVIFGLSARRVWQLRDHPIFADARPWLLVSALLIIIIAISLPVSLAKGTPIAQWLRDTATYGLFAAAPIFALDAAASMRRGLVLGLTVVFATLGLLSFGIYWITLRNLAVLPIEQLVLPTASLPTVLFLVAFAAAVVDRPRRIPWILLSGVTLGVFLVSGTRSALLILVAVPIIVALAGRARLRASSTAGVGLAVVATVFVLGVQSAFVGAIGELPPPIDVGPPIASSPSGSGSGAPPSGGSSEPTTTPVPTPRPTANADANLYRRIQDFLASPQRDGSVRERLTQYGVAWDLFLSSPVVGVGLGHPIEWIRIDGTRRVDFTADTPLILPAKLGILGLVWVTALALVWVRFVWRLRQRGVNIPGLVMGGWAVVIVALSWTGFSVEDKGFSFALMLILALGLMELQRRPIAVGDSVRTPLRDDRQLVPDRAEHQVRGAPTTFAEGKQ